MEGDAKPLKYDYENATSKVSFAHVYKYNEIKKKGNRS